MEGFVGTFTFGVGEILALFHILGNPLVFVQLLMILVIGDTMFSEADFRYFIDIVSKPVERSFFQNINLLLYSIICCRFESKCVLIFICV